MVDKKLHTTVTEEDLQWLSEKDAARYRKDIKRLSKTSLLARILKGRGK